MLLSQTCRYGLRAVLYLATKETRDTEYVSISKISQELDISFHFLTKILQQLTQAGVLTSYRGPGGGVAFAQDPAELTPYDIVVTLEGPGLFTSCVLGLSDCDDDNPCPLHTKWTQARNQLRKAFGSKNLHQLAKGIESADFRLAN